MKERDLTNIIFSRFGVNPPKEFKETDKDVYGFDTETYNGAVSILGVEGKDYSGHLVSDDPDQILSFLCKRRFCGMKSVNFFFNVKYDRDAVIKCLPDENINHLKAYDYTIYKNFKIKIVGNKAFSISKLKGGIKPKRTAFFSDISPFYALGSLENTVKEGLKLEYKKGVDIQDGVRFDNDKAYIQLKKGGEKFITTQEIVKYCLDDCYYTQLLCQNIVDLAEGMVNVTRYFSPASISKCYLRNNFNEGYKFHRNPIQQYALWSFSGGRFEVLKKGWFNKIHMADINSAYPFILSTLHKPEGASTSNYEYEPESLYSYFCIDLELSEEMIMSPFKHCIRSMGDLLVFPTGRFTNVFVNKREYEILKENGCKVEIIKAYHIFNKEPVLWVDGITEMYYKRRELKDLGDRKEHLLKLILNSLYGVLIQLNKVKTVSPNWEEWEEDDPDKEFIDLDLGRFIVRKLWAGGQWFNPVMAAEITAGTRCQIYNDFKGYERNIIMIATDSITMNRKIKFPNTTELGGYGHYDKTSGVVLANGIYQFKNGLMGKRGLMSDDPIDLFEMFEDCKKDRIELTKTRPKSLREGTPQGYSKTDANKLINCFIPFKREVSVDMDKKRNWHDQFKNFNEVLDYNISSSPLHIGT